MGEDWKSNWKIGGDADMVRCALEEAGERMHETDSPSGGCVKDGLEALSRLEAEHARVVADNAALLGAGSELLECADGAMPYAERRRRIDDATAVLERAHSGSALLEENKRLRADAERLAALRGLDAHALAERAWETLRTYSSNKYGVPMSDWREGPQVFRDHRVAFVRVLLTLLLEPKP